MSVQLQRWTFTVDEYHRMAEVGILTEDDRVELIDGEIIKMSPHSLCGLVRLVDHEPQPKG